MTESVFSGLTNKLCVTIHVFFGWLYGVPIPFWQRKIKQNEKHLLGRSGRCLFIFGHCHFKNTIVYIENSRVPIPIAIGTNSRKSQISVLKIKIEIWPLLNFSHNGNWIQIRVRQDKEKYYRCRWKIRSPRYYWLLSCSSNDRNLWWMQGSLRHLRTPCIPLELA